MKSPEPSSRNRPDSNPLADDNIASMAVETVEDVFTSNLATYAVRKPYGGDEEMEYTFAEEHFGEIYQKCPVSWIEPVPSYLKNATVKDEKSLEVLARLEADGSILIIYGNSCRHGVPNIGNDGAPGYEFQTFDNVEYMEDSLGKIIYVDSEGNDGEYWLDSVYEEALKIRESYCSNVFSAALALKASSPHSSTCSNGTPVTLNGFGQHHESPALSSPPIPSPRETPKVPVADACVGTEDLSQKPQREESRVNSENPANSAPKPPKSQPIEKEKIDQSAQDQDTGSTDVLSSFIIYFFSTIFSIVWFFVMIPVRVTRFTIKITIIFGFLHYLWLFLADNNDALGMGALINTNYNIN